MSALKSNCWLFAGPTLNGTTRLAEQAGVRVLPPIQRGDVDHLVLTRRPGVIAIVDGKFHQCLSVGHAEIRSAIEAGWQVWGLSSMGAIRACEMRHLGMRGYGEVYAWFCRDANFRDDEVALVHLPDAPYFPISEPLIHIRLWLKELVTMRWLTTTQGTRVLRKLMSMWFGERTLLTAQKMIVAEIPKRVKQIDKSLENFDRFRVKSHDLKAFLRDQPWKCLH
jgi:hypothetical protein